jgi:hypothetical protein
MFNVGSALGAVTAGALSLILGTKITFQLASFIILTGAFAVTMIQLESRAHLVKHYTGKEMKRLG